MFVHNAHMVHAFKVLIVHLVLDLMPPLCLLSKCPPCPGSMMPINPTLSERAMICHYAYIFLICVSMSSSTIFNTVLTVLRFPFPSIDLPTLGPLRIQDLYSGSKSPR